MILINNIAKIFLFILYMKTFRLKSKRRTVKRRQRKTFGKKRSYRMRGG